MEGKCFHLYTRVRASQVFRGNLNQKSAILQRLSYLLSEPDHKVPEICRVPLEELCLQILAMGHSDVSTFLGRLCVDCMPSDMHVLILT